MHTTASAPNTALLRQRFEIAAAHRLHAPALTDEQNRAYFGKCNNPSGHGHNYIIEPCVAVPTGAQAGNGVFTAARLEQLVDQAIIQPYDHTHLNIDTAAFDQTKPSGVNPSVENIARIFFEALAPLVSASGATLKNIRVWETEKTSASFPI
jgi:6-pyruvoyltetrahydropterin/6-carboxytetrahydropterin synthase